MIVVEESLAVACTARRLVEFVMDIEAYAEIDDKIRPVLWSRREGDVVEFACRPTLAGLRQPKVVQQVRLVDPQRIEISLSPAPHNRLARATAQLSASFDCTPLGSGILLTRRLEFRIAPWARWLLEPLLRRRLPAEVHEELARAKAHLECGS